MLSRLLISILTATTVCQAADEWKFQFGDGQSIPGFTRIETGTIYDDKRGFGILPGATTDATVFALDVEEGNYDVTVRLGHATKGTKTTVKAESRRLMLHEIETKPGQFEERTFTVNVRKPAIAGGGVTSLKEREKGPPAVPDWDEHLTIEFNGSNIGVSTMMIQPAKEAATVFIAGDSTVTDQAHGPYFGWGQMLPRWFKQGVAISNHAESGLALFSFEGGKRLKKIQSMMKPGDYLFIQFGHNDQKDKKKGAGPFTTYKANLKKFIAAAREKGGLPVLVTPMERLRWDGGKQGTTLGDYAEAVRQTADEEKVPVIDLNAMSLKLYAALGPNDSARAFVHYPANTFPGRPEALKDNTHHNDYGGYELSRCVVEGIKTQVPELAKHLVDDAGAFDPSKPDDFKKLVIPWNQNVTAPKPDGN